MTNYNKIDKKNNTQEPDMQTQESEVQLVGDVKNVEDIRETPKIVTINTWLNIRSEKSIDSDIIGVLKPNDVVEIVEDLGEWLTIEFDNKIGNILSAYTSR